MSPSLRSCGSHETVSTMPREESSGGGWRSPRRRKGYDTCRDAVVMFKKTSVKEERPPRCCRPRVRYRIKSKTKQRRKTRNAAKPWRVVPFRDESLGSGGNYQPTFSPTGATPMLATPIAMIDSAPLLVVIGSVNYRDGLRKHELVAAVGVQIDARHEAFLVCPDNRARARRTKMQEKQGTN